MTDLFRNALYDDIHDSNLSITKGRENPVTAAINAFSQLQGIEKNANVLTAQREQIQERRNLKNALSGMDTNNPDIGRIIQVAPQIGVKYLQELGQLDNQKRLMAVQKANEVMIRHQAGLASLYEVGYDNPQIFDNFMQNMASFGADPALLGITPNPRNYPDKNSYQRALGFMMDASKQLKGINDQATQELKNQGIIAKSASNERVAGINLEGKKIGLEATQTKGMYDLASAKVRSSGQPKEYQDAENNWHLLTLGTDGDIVDKKMPPGYKPKSVVGKEGGGKGPGGKIGTVKDFLGMGGGNKETAMPSNPSGAQKLEGKLDPKTGKQLYKLPDGSIRPWLGE
jgi:hypothetical protein